MIIFTQRRQFVSGKKCNKTSLVSVKCLETETCMITTGTCECLPDFKRINGTCENVTDAVSPSETKSALIDDGGNGRIVAGILIPLFLIMFVMCGVYVSRKYRLVGWLRAKLNQRNKNYDEVMIGQDPEDDDDLPLRD